MILVQSIIKVSDNSGARFAQCIRVLVKKPRSSATVGDIIIVSVKRVTPNKKIKKGTIQKGVVVRVAKKYSTHGW